MCMEVTSMTDEFLTPEQEAFKNKILEMERESISNITKTDDKQLISRIIRLYEEEQKNDN